MPVGLYPGANSYTGNGVTTSFAYSFRILDEDDLLVTVDGVTKTITTDYTVSGVGDAGGGNVVFVAAPASAAAIVIARDRDYKRDTDYQRNGSFDEETVDADFDGLVMLIQQLYADRLRGFKAPLEVTADQVLTSAMWAARASTFLGFNASGTFGVYGIADFDGVVASAFVLTLVDDTDADSFVQTLVAALTAETSPAANDVLLIGDTSESKGNKMTFENVLKVVNALTEDTTPDPAADFVLTYDASGAVAKKALPNNLVPAASDTYAGRIEVAVQSEMEAATSTTLAVTPGRLRYHPGAAKWWADWDNTGAVAVSHNVTSVTDNGTGDWTVNLTNNYSSGNHAAFGTPAGNTFTSMTVAARGAGSVQFNLFNSGGATDGGNRCFGHGLGDQ